MIADYDPIYLPTDLFTHTLRPYYPTCTRYTERREHRPVAGMRHACCRTAGASCAESSNAFRATTALLRGRALARSGAAGARRELQAAVVPIAALRSRPSEL
eukprot:SAG25_NODE_7115_length_503_cov_1.247525_2_plen_101_part_01